MASAVDSSGREAIEEPTDVLSRASEVIEESAVELKNKGNIFFQKAEFDRAIAMYSTAIDKEPSAILYGNRSQCFLKKELYGVALDDANAAIDLDRNYVKAYYRRATAYMALGKAQKALKDYEAVCKVCPNDEDAKKRRDECKRLVRRMMFEKAIAVENNRRPITESINLDNLPVDDSYDGPRLEGPITALFMEQLMIYFKAQKRLHIKYAFKMLLDFYALMQNQPNLVEIEIEGDQEFTVCGDIHGQFYDLCNIFDLRGTPGVDRPYLFNGDFVDRGSWSVETVFTLIGFKLLYPKHFFLSRGNHESDVMNKMYGFENEVKTKYNSLMTEFFTEIFCNLPLCHLINKKVFICHGGLFRKDGVTLADIQAVDRVRQPPDEGIMCDLLWSDPMDEFGRTSSKRGVGCQFGPDVTEQWCNENGIDYVIRSHEVKPEGYEIQAGARCYTLFSAPNYCDQVGNLGAYAIIKAPDLKPKFVTFAAVPHPPCPPMRYANSIFGF